jgi:hypothetical protein
MPGIDEKWHWRRGPVAPGPAVIFDIDGVLADAAPRQHHLDHGDWKAFFEACDTDPVIVEIERLAALLDPSLHILLVTGRPNRVQQKTATWLAENGIRWDVLVTREKGDYVGVDIFKRQTLHDFRTYGFDVKLAIEDDPKNHAMYIAEGVPCIYIHSGYYLNE